MADLTLYGISNEFDYICDLIDRDVLEPEEEERLTEMIVDKIENSGEEILKFVKSNRSQIDGIKKEIQDLQARKKQAENREEILKARLTENMKKMNLPKIKTDIGTILVPKSTTISVNVVDIEQVPKEYVKEKVEKSADKAAIKKHFKETGEILPGTNIIEKEGQVQFR